MTSNQKSEFVFLISVFFVNFIVPVSSSSRDVALLLQIKNNQLDDINGRLINWNESSLNAPCNWNGIGCNHRSQTIDSIDFTSFGIAGEFPADFCRIQSLRSLNLYDNSFTGSISSNSITLCSRIRFLNISSNLFDGKLLEFGMNFVNLIKLDLSVNSFTGEFPLSFGLFPALQVLNVGGNLFNGSIPIFLTNLTELTHLQLGYNPYYPSPLPSNIGRLVKLQILWIPNSNLIGTIPESIGNLTLLKHLDLSNNSISGSIPESIGGLRNAESIELYENNLSGELPDSFSNLANLLWFDCSENNLTGKVPESLAGLTLESFNVNDNQLDGIIPDVLSKNPNLIEMKFFNNRFTGSLPIDLGQNSNLEEFDVSGNQLEGSLPPNLCYGKKLNRLIAFNNRLTGNIPESYGDCDSLTYIRVFNNQISGHVPFRFWSFPEIQMLQLDNNQFEGAISPLIAGARGLTQLLLSNNRFSGKFPSEICGLTELVVVDISTNQFSGELPSCITNLTRLQKLDLQINAFNGEIPTNLSSWTKLAELNLSNNKLAGSIPATLADLLVLTYLDLSRNFLTGNIPAALTKLKLNKFNLTYNRLEGRIPTGFNHEFFVQSLTGNPNLCGSDLKPIPSCSRSRPISMLLVGILAILAFILFTSLLWILIKSKKLIVFGRRNSRSWKITSFQRVEFNEDDMLGSLTNVNLIGSGGSGRVYRVKLKTGQTVAVKKLLGVNQQPEMETAFLSEVETLGRTRHGNIVKLLCSCIGEGFRVLVYEYMENGSLADVLHGEKGGPVLNWAKRFEIAIGSARGLAYLHHDCVPAIVHRDIKSNNILLDENFTPRVADFGLAKSLDFEVNDSNGRMMSRIAGSYGYIAPEYGYTTKITEKSDVYSYGVVLLELLTGKRPNDPSFGENNDIVKWVTEIVLSIPKNETGDLNSQRITELSQIIDSKMDLTIFNYMEIEKVLDVALLCTSAFPINRPSMRRVSEMLVKDRQFARLM